MSCEGTTVCPVCGLDIGVHTHDDTMVSAWRWAELANEEALLRALDGKNDYTLDCRSFQAKREIRRRMARLAVENIRLAAEARLRDTALASAQRDMEAARERERLLQVAICEADKLVLAHSMPYGWEDFVRKTEPLLQPWQRRLTSAALAQSSPAPSVEPNPDSPPFIPPEVTELDARGYERVNRNAPPDASPAQGGGMAQCPATTRDRLSGNTTRCGLAPGHEPEPHDDGALRWRDDAAPPAEELTAKDAAALLVAIDSPWRWEGKERVVDKLRALAEKARKT